MDTKTDGELLAAFSVQHDEQAFQVVVQRHARLVMSVARTTIGNATEAEDVFQAVFVKLAQQARSLSREESVGGWLHTVTRRTALDAIKQTVRQQQRQQRYTTMNDAPATEDPPMELDDEQRRILFDEVARLPDRLRVPVILCFCEGLPQQAAARQAGCSQSTLSWRLSKASDLLRGSLERRGLRRPGAIGSCLAAAVGWVSVPEALVAQTVHNAGLLVSSTTAAGGGLTLLPPNVAQLVNANLGLGLSAKVGIAVLAAASIVGGVLLVDKLASRDTADDRSPGNAAVQPAVAAVSNAVAAAEYEDGAILFQDSFENGLGNWTLFAKQADGNMVADVGTDIRVITVECRSSGKRTQVAVLRGTEPGGRRVGIVMQDLGVKPEAFSISYDYTFEGRPRLAMEGIQFDMSSMELAKAKTLPQANPSGELNTVRMEFVRKSEQPENGFLRYENTLFFNGERIGKRVEYIKPEEASPHLSLVVVEGQFWFDDVVVREMKKVER